MKHLNQSGRSMIEILAVMAIIGIFSVGGIIAFKEGMNSQKAKYILEQVKLRVNEAISSAELSKGHRKQVYTPEYINKIDTEAYGYSFHINNISTRKGSLAYYLAGKEADSTVEVVACCGDTEIKSHKPITFECKSNCTFSEGLCQKLKEKMAISGDVKKINGTDVSEFTCPESGMSSITLEVCKNKKNCG